jgi:hypothetical protein
MGRSVAETSVRPSASYGCDNESRKEAAMLQRTPRQALQENQETGVRRIIRTFDPEVPGYVFWPIIFGMAAALQQLVIRL